MKKNPWFKFHPSDWLTDPDLRNCPSACRSLLIDLMCLAHSSSEYGFFGDGSASDLSKHLEKTLCIDRRVLVKQLETLAEHTRITQDEHGRWYIKRMVQDAQHSAVMSNHGKRGGNPRLKPEENRRDKKRESEAPRFSLLDLKDKLCAKQAILDGMDRTKPEARQLTKQIRSLRKQIADYGE